MSGFVIGEKRRAFARHLLIGVTTALALMVFAASAGLTYRLGFPLDDAWIHQTYARNLVVNAEWAFLPGTPSAGSTSPLWSLLLSGGYLLKLPPYLWTIFLGWLALWASVELGTYSIRKLSNKWGLAGILLTVLTLGLEWHLVWAAASGMETILQVAFVLLVTTWLLAGWKRWFWLGVVIGLSVWVRPDGLTLLGPVAFVLASLPGTMIEREKRALNMLLGFAIPFSAYLAFNIAIGGDLWPNTFFAKQAEYAVERLAPLSSRLLEQAQQPMVGIGIVLLPGFIYGIWQALQHRKPALIACYLWSAGFLALYAIRLPVTYQHGRYVIPAMPVIWLLGLSGSLEMLRIQSSRRWLRIISRVWLVSMLLVQVSFFILGARAYSRDVAFIESEMVDTAQWVAAYTPERAVIAAHDIGALGYFSGREIIDLAGLISPEVIPFIRNDATLASFLDTQQADYLVVFPGWYSHLPDGKKSVYTSSGKFSPSQGGENMVVYCWICSP